MFLKTKNEKTIDLIKTSFINGLNKDSTYKKSNGLPDSALSVEYLHGNEKLDQLISDLKRIDGAPTKETQFSEEVEFNKIMDSPVKYHFFKDRIKILKKDKHLKSDQDLVNYLCKKPSELTYILSFNWRISTKSGFKIDMYNHIFFNLWSEGDDLCLLPKDIMNISKIRIPIVDIISFSRDGDVFNETHISGGGGGGSSIAGAIIGGIVAGETGAIIGSRNKMEKIKSENVVNDKRITILQYKKNNENKCLLFDSNAYDVFLNLIPNKQFDLVQMEQKIGDNKNEIISQIKALSDLKEQGILTQEEFNEKKRQLLDKI